MPPPRRSGVAILASVLGDAATLFDSSRDDGEGRDTGAVERRYLRRTRPRIDPLAWGRFRVRVRGVLFWKRLFASLIGSRNLSPAVLLLFLAIFDSLSTRRQLGGHRPYGDLLAEAARLFGGQFSGRDPVRVRVAWIRNRTEARLARTDDVQLAVKALR
jgi:hypothetical protein